MCPFDIEILALTHPPPSPTSRSADRKFSGLMLQIANKQKMEQKPGTEKNVSTVSDAQSDTK